MVEEQDGKSAFDYFWENVKRLQADQHFREVLRELDERRKETLSLLVSDPAAFLRYRGVEIPQDFRVSVKRTVEDAATHGSGAGQGLEIICDCIVICFLRYCAIYCDCVIAD
jgi:hypothetical protein